MSDEWLTYKEAATVLGVSPENVRHRAIRGRWPRRVGNDKRAKIQLPDNPNPARTVREPPSALPVELGANPQIIKALGDHLVTMREQLAQAQARIGELTADLEGREAQHLAEIAEERGKVAQAHAELVALADRLAVLVEANQRRPWWRRLLAG
jgi:uncharacterized coiled-coil protein SlyX